MQLKPIQAVHLFFCGSILLFAAVTLFLNREVLHLDLTLKNVEPIAILAPIIAVVGLLASPFMFNKIISGIDENSTPSTKFMKYQSAFIIKCAFLEAGALINIVCSFVTYNVLFIAFAACCFIALWLSRPTKDKIYSTLQLENTTPLDGI